MVLERLMLLMLIVAGVLPLAREQFASEVRIERAVEWPSHFEGHELLPIALSAGDQLYPGRVARFTDGQREIVFRSVERATRSLHSASDCLKASGYRIEHKPMRRDADGTQWGCFAAYRANTGLPGNGLSTGLSAGLSVCERIYNEQQSFSDVSSWFWSAALGRSTGPWLAVTVASPSEPL